MTEIKFRSDIGVEYIQHMGTDEMVAKAARVSTGKDQEETVKINGLIRYLASERHTSPFEHTGLTVRVEAPIFVAREAMRHRTFSFNEISGRYAKLKPEFYVPSDDRPLVNKGTGARPNLVTDAEVGKWTYNNLQSMTRAIHIDQAEESWEIYEHLLNEGVATEVARNVLPVGTYTSWYMTGNLHAWFNFFNLRSGRVGHPQFEIVDMSLQVEDIVKDLFPVSAEAWGL